MNAMLIEKVIGCQCLRVFKRAEFCSAVSRLNRHILIVGCRGAGGGRCTSDSGRDLGLNHKLAIDRFAP